MWTKDFVKSGDRASKVLAESIEHWLWLGQDGCETVIVIKESDGFVVMAQNSIGGHTYSALKYFGRTHEKHDEAMEAAMSASRGGP